MIRLHNYNDLTLRRENILKKKEEFYRKYYTRDDEVLREMIIESDAGIWYKLVDELIEVEVLIRKFKTA